MEKRTIRVQGQAVVSGEPDLVILSFGVRAKNFSYRDCLDDLYERVDQLRKELEAVDIERTEMKTADLSISTDYEWVKDKRVFKGYLANQSLTLRLPMDRQRLNRVLEKITYTKSGAELNIYFGLKDESALRQRALEEAVANARKNAETLANAAGVKLGDLLQIDYGWAEVRVRSRTRGVYSMAEPLAEAAPPDIEPEGAYLGDSVTTIWEISGDGQR